MDKIKEIELKDIKKLVKDMRDNTIISVDLTPLTEDTDVTESVTENIDEPEIEYTAGMRI